jgi:hypothetical protein
MTGAKQNDVVAMPARSHGCEMEGTAIVQEFSGVAIDAAFAKLSRTPSSMLSGQARPNKRTRMNSHSE